MPRSWRGVSRPGANAPRCILFVRARRESRYGIFPSLQASAFPPRTDEEGGRRQPPGVLEVFLRALRGLRGEMLMPDQEARTV
jgi:hypothetical protein